MCDLIRGKRLMKLIVGLSVTFCVQVQCLQTLSLWQNILPKAGPVCNLTKCEIIVSNGALQKGLG